MRNDGKMLINKNTTAEEAEDIFAERLAEIIFSQLNQSHEQTCRQRSSVGPLKLKPTANLGE